MAEKLTYEQKMAVENRGGKLLVSAAAGSGKTKVLVDRLLMYLTDPVAPANIDDFLIITYTKAAASELRGKIAAKLSERIAQDPENRHLHRQLQRLYLTKISTVHAFCGDLLREFAYKMDLSADFRVADENECRELRERTVSSILEHAYETAGEDPDFCAFVDTQGFGRDDRLVPEIIMKVYDSARCHLDPDGWLRNCLEKTNTEGITDAAQTLWGEYLLADLHHYLDMQIDVLNKCAALASVETQMEKPVTLLRATIEQLKDLRHASTWDQVVALKNIDYGRLTFSKKISNQMLADQIKALRNACKTGLEKKLTAFSDPSEQILSDLQQTTDAMRGLVGLVQQFDQEYSQSKKRRRILDFGDLEHRTLDLLLGRSRSVPTAVAKEIGRRFREIMVDEYQDSNAVQDAIFSALTQEKRNCFMVGDVKQSIYQFRLADPGIFLRKYHDYVPAEEAKPGEGRKIMLSRNFRSGGAVLEASNDVFRTCMSPAVGGLYYTDDEALREGIEHIPLGEPEIELTCLQVQEDTYLEEADYTAKRIRELLDGNHMIREGASLRPIREEDIVILLRSPGSIGGHYRQALESIGIRCTTGTGNNLLYAEEIAVLRAFLQVINNPQQDIPLLATLASPIFAVTADDLAALRISNRKCSIYDAVKESEQPKLQHFMQILAQLRRSAGMDTLAQLIGNLFDLTRMDSIYSAMGSGEVRNANLQTFLRMAIEFEGRGRKDLAQFLQHLDVMEQSGLSVSNEEGTSGCVTLMSIHKSKGLEFPVVFLCGLSREFNRENLRAQVLCDQKLGLGLSAADSRNRLRYPTLAKRAIMAHSWSESVSEELRVLYVAMTRAKDRLIMVYSQKNLQDELADLALRLDHTPRELLTREAVCHGHWILLTALQKTEAGQLHGFAQARPAETILSQNPWKIQVVTGTPSKLTSIEKVAEEKAELDVHTVAKMRRALGFLYPHSAATQTPSKQTATQRKGRIKDQEILENVPEPKAVQRPWRKASFVQKEQRGTAYGSAMHALLQYIHYDRCDSVAGVRREVNRLVDRKLLTQEQGELINCRSIAALFETPLGQKLMRDPNVLREFKFSILDDGEEYTPGMQGENVLLQGVVDCAIVEHDGITVIDFKTDYVTEESIAGLADRYSAQVQTYAGALQRIFRKKIKASYLYFFHLGCFVEV